MSVNESSASNGLHDPAPAAAASSAGGSHHSLGRASDHLAVPQAATHHSAAAADADEAAADDALLLKSPQLGGHVAVGRRASIASLISQGATANFGGKTIGMLGGVALLINNLTGSGMVLFPSLYQQAGWLPVTLALCLLAVLSTICGVMVVESMAMIPGNAKFEKRVEYTSLAKYYLHRHLYAGTQLVYQLSLACNNMSMIIQSVQVMDFTIAAIFGKSCAVPEFSPNPGFHCPPAVTGDITPFGPNVYLLSVGFLATAAVCLPLGFFNLNDNIIVQKGAFASVLSIVLVWIGLFASEGLHTSYVPAWGSDVSQVLGVTVFNFAIITSIPSWVNEKQEEVSIMRTFAYSMPVAVLLFSCIGVFGGLAFVPWFNSSDPNDTILNKLYDTGSVLARITFYFFPVVVNLTSIPIFSIMCRYNLIENKVCGPRMANFLGVVLPWLVCIPLYTGNGFSELANWAGVILNSIVNFIVPPIIYIVAIERQQRAAQRGAAARSHAGSHAGSAAASPRVSVVAAAPPLKVHVQTNGSASREPLLAVVAADNNTLPAVTSPARSLGRSGADALIDHDAEAAALQWSVVPARLWPYRVAFSKGLVVFMLLLCSSVIIVQIVAAAGVNV